MCQHTYKDNSYHKIPLEKASKQDFYRELHKIADAAEPTVRRQILEMFEEISDEAGINKLRDAVAANNLNAVMSILGISQVKASSMVETLRRVFNKTAEKTLAENMPKRVQANMRFDMLNPRSVEMLRAQGANLVTRINETTRMGIRQLMIDSFEQGIPPRQIAEKIKHRVGLTPKHLKAVQNFEAMLLSEGVEPGVVARRVEAYRKRLLRWRARNIARTETIRAANGGQQALWDQAVENNLIDPNKTTKKWIVTPDDRLAVASKTPIMTIDGWKPVNTIEVGDYVLTHKDRFRKVVAVNKKYYKGDFIKFALNGKARIKVSVTPNHPILINDDWVDAENVKASDFLTVLAKPCPDCGELKSQGPGSTSEVCYSCNIVRVNKKRWSDSEQHRNLSERNKRRWSDEKNRRSMSAAIKKLWTDETYLANIAKAEPQRREKLSIRASSGSIGFGAMDYEQKIQIIRDHIKHKRNYGLSGEVPNELPIAEFLIEQDLEFIPQWEYEYIDRHGKLKTGFADFYLPGPNLVIECNPTKWTCPKKRAKFKSLEEQGYIVLEFSSREIKDGFSNVASEIRKHCCFKTVQMKSIKRYSVKKQTVFDLQVEEDESFVAGGIVVHNCPICRPVPSENTNVPIDGQFQTSVVSVDYPPLHPQCRCAVGLSFGK